MTTRYEESLKSKLVNAKKANTSVVKATMSKGFRFGGSAVRSAEALAA